MKKRAYHVIAASQDVAQNDLSAGSASATSGQSAVMNALRAKVRAWRKFIVTYEPRVIIVAPVEPLAATTRAADPDDESESVIVETLSQFESITPEIPQSFSNAKLRDAVKEGSFLVCVRRPAASGTGKHIVAYRICERAVFRSPGVRKRISPQFLFIHYAEVLPEHRGKRIAGQLREYVHQYARGHGIRWTCGVVNVANSASVAAHLRANGDTNPKVARRIDVLRFFGGRFTVATPWSSIKKALEQLTR
jgi:GNAT superfamily N-acetyltransferase